MDDKTTYENVLKDLEHNNFLSTPRNNLLLKLFLEAKFNGGYGRLIFQKKINDVKTGEKKARNIKKIDDYFKKDFDKITEKEVLLYRNKLNNDEIYCSKTLVNWEIDPKTNKNTYIYSVEKTKTPLSYRTKIDYATNFIEFYKFVIEYVYQETGKEIQDIVKYFKIQSPSDFQPVKVEFIPENEIPLLLPNINNVHFRNAVKLSLMSGARPCELPKIRYGKGYYHRIFFIRYSFNFR